MYAPIQGGGDCGITMIVVVCTYSMIAFWITQPLGLMTQSLDTYVLYARGRSGEIKYRLIHSIYYVYSDTKQGS